MPRQVASPSPVTAPSDVVQGQQKFSVQEQTRIESLPQTRFIGAYAAEAAAPVEAKKMMAHGAPAAAEQTGPGRRLAGRHRGPGTRPLPRHRRR